MILLLEPERAPGFVSGGYRYQAEILWRLAARGEGELRAIAASALHEVVATERRQQPAPTVVVDGLFVELLQQPLPAGVVALLHCVPGMQPWSRAPLPVIATSQPTADAVRANARSVAVVRPGLDACFVRGEARLGDRTLRVVCVGSISPGKNQRLVAQALAALSTLHHVPCELVLLGSERSDPAYVASLVATAATLPLHILGVQPPERVAEELQRADLFVSASRQEAFGMAAAEAAACGVPVLAFRTGEIHHFVRDGQNGWLVQASASDAEFTRRLHSVVHARQALAAARENAFRPILASWDAVADQFVDACRRAV